MGGEFDVTGVVTTGNSHASSTSMIPDKAIKVWNGFSFMELPGSLDVTLPQR
jgi:hypothetical protein